MWRCLGGLHIAVDCQLPYAKRLSLPAKLESQLTPITGDYGRYTLGRHVVLIKKADLAIADILKNVAVKQTVK